MKTDNHTEKVISEAEKATADLAFQEELQAAEKAGCDFLEARLAEKNPLTRFPSKTEAQSPR